MAQKNSQEMRDILKKVNTFMKSSGDGALSEDLSISSKDQFLQQRKLLQELTMCLKTSEDEKRVARRRNKYLLAEIQELRSASTMEREKLLQIQKNFEVLQKHIETSNKLKQEYKILMENTNNKSASSDKLTDKCTQTEILEGTEDKERNFDPSLSFPKSELHCLEEDLQQIKELLACRENRWNKILKHAHEQSAMISKVEENLSKLPEGSLSKSSIS